MLFEPQNAMNLRCRYAPSLLAFEEPAKKMPSGPDFSRIASSWSPISLTASSQLMRFHLPSTSFIGYLMRFSPWP
jgi:hypothetical protein